jgi:prepilin-type N-terminal cleavage/methylation domain-containing protein
LERSMNAVIDRIKRRLSGPESGFTLLELVVALGIFSIFIVMFLAAVVGLARGTSRTQLTAESTSATLSVFQTLDRQVRYADAINFPGASATARYIEFRVPAESARLGVDTCYQWRYLTSTRSLAFREWPAGGTTPTAWSTKLTTMVNVVGATYPFSMVPAQAAAPVRTKQQLKLIITAGSSELNAGAAIDTMFVARNSSTASASNIPNASGQSATPVCQLAVTRP